MAEQLDMGFADRCRQSAKLAERAAGLGEQFFVFDEGNDLWSVRHGRRQIVHPGIDKERANALAHALNQALESNKKLWEQQARDMIR